MAIQIPNPGTGNGATGDNEFVLWSKVKDNFSDQTNAASKLVGTGTGHMSLNGDLSKRVFSLVPPRFDTGSDVFDAPFGISYYSIGTLNTPLQYTNILTIKGYAETKIQLGFGYTSLSSLYFRSTGNNGSEGEWHQVYHTGNTTKDSATGFLKASSPVLHVYNDSITKIHEAEQLDITVEKKGVGHYEIHGTTGLRKNDGWNMSPPRDLHSNVLCMIEVTEIDNVIILKTYKRKFDLELAAIVHDYDNPLDIPEGACVEFRFNDLPQDDLDDTQTEEVVLDK